MYHLFLSQQTYKKITNEQRKIGKKMTNPKRNDFAIGRWKELNQNKNNKLQVTVIAKNLENWTPCEYHTVF